MMNRILSTLLIWLILSCKTQQISPTNQPQINNNAASQGSAAKIFDESIAKKVAFVGNSQTYVNDVPKMVQEIGELEKNFINITNFAVPNYSLEDHWNDGQVQVALDKGKFDFMVAQQGSSALPESQVLLKEYARRFAEICKKHQTKMNLYMVWPIKSRLFDLDNVIYSYTEAAKATESSLSPVGLAWKKAWAIQPNITFYSPDELHASKKGSIMAAIVIYASLFKKKDLSFIKLQNMSWQNDLTDEEFRIFINVVEEIMK
jgi:hypothetical protein